MATRTVRLDDETEEILEELRRKTGMSVSDVLKEGVRALREENSRRAIPTPFEVYRELDLGPGGYATSPSTDVRRGVREAIRKKLRR
ncbi:MAG TPA: ribbon-helix-helix protein, CopG family [Vicinamibacteria bacterium]|jgi:Arc/MetJ-type ribon-helix-helix transcriptional regulator|nr:ribbon-helix-helix protein, CopG family [Vicinamibacteria bacterium]